MNFSDVTDGSTIFLMSMQLPLVIHQNVLIVDPELINCLKALPEIREFAANQKCEFVKYTPLADFRARLEVLSLAFVVDIIHTYPVRVFLDESFSTYRSTKFVSIY